MRSVRRLRAGLFGNPERRGHRFRLPRPSGRRGARLREEPRRRGMRQLRPVRQHLPDRGPHREAGNRSGLEGPAGPRKRGSSPRWPRPVRVGLGECFGLAPGSLTIGQIVAALKMIGFDEVYDTSFAADLTVIEEASEFLRRKAAGEKLPQFTSCCPGVGQVRRTVFPGNPAEPVHLPVSSADVRFPGEGDPSGKSSGLTAINCTSSPSCRARPRNSRLNGPNSKPMGVRDVDNVLTTQELARMIEAAGIRFDKLQPESFDMPFGFSTGAGVIFGNSGGVTEAVLRYAAEKATGPGHTQGGISGSARGLGGCAKPRCRWAKGN